MHKDGQIDNVKLISGVTIAEMSNYKIAVLCIQRMEVIVKMKKERNSQGEGWVMVDVYKEWKLL